MHTDVTTYPAHISSKGQIVFLLCLSVDLRALWKLLSGKRKFLPLSFFSVPSFRRFVPGWAEAGGHPILFKCPGLSTA